MSHIFKIMSTSRITTHWTNMKYIQKLREHRDIVMKLKDARHAVVAADEQSIACRKNCETVTHDLLVSRKSLDVAEKFLGVPSVVEEAAIWIDNIVTAEADFSAVDAYDASLMVAIDDIAFAGATKIPDCPGAPRKPPPSANYTLCSGWRSTQTPMLERWLDDSVGGGPGPGPEAQTLVTDYYPKRRIKFTDATPSNHYNLRPRTK
jgi:hypothetical protein